MAKLRAGHGVVVKYRRPQGRRLSLAQRWDQALEEQRAVIEAVRAWRETMPPGIADGDRAEAVDGFLDAAVS
jgi:predicted Zn-dependent protease